ncbi:DUF6778 family protein [Yoonia vestfoldensis]|uniref:DUF6778 family protein n=1 Tax=Yoonia vestfoldensis TaxID=245188 RepID=UPI001FE00A3C|nr:DUF6778 family protein [Yoonia vestfoldensis]
MALLLGALAACAPGAMVTQGDPRPDVERDYRLVALDFSTLPNLVVSEANTYYPQADVVWRGDPAGDRIAQIEALFTEAARRNMDGGADIKNANSRVVMDVTLVRFHGLTRRTQFSTGGVYNIIFDVAIRDAGTGAVIEPSRRVVANLDSWGGNTNAQLEERGITQKIRVTEFLTTVLADQLR